MANDNLEDGEKPPNSISPQQRNEELKSCIVNEATHFARTFDDHNGAGDNVMPIPYTLIPFSPLCYGDTHVTPQPYTQEMPGAGANLITDVSQFNSTQNPWIDHSSIYKKGYTSQLSRPISDFPSLEGSMNELCPFPGHHNTVNLDNVKNAYDNSLQKPQIDRKLINVRDSSAVGLKIINQDGEATDSDICVPRLSRNFINHEVSKPDGGELGIKKNFMVSSVESSCTEKPDGSFLTLGIRGNTEARSNFIVGNTGRIVLPQLNSLSQKEKSSSLNFGLKKTVEGMSTLGSWTSCNNDLEVDKQHHIPLPRFSNTDPNLEVQDYPALSSKPLASGEAGLPDTGESQATGLQLLSSSIRSTTQPASDQLQKCYLESSRSSSLFTGSTTRQNQSGQRFSGTQTAEGGLFPQRIGLQPAGQPFPVNEGSAAEVGQGIPGAKGNENAQASSDLVGPSLERSANEIPPAAIQVQRRKTKTPQPFIPPSMATLAQIAPLSLQTKSAAFASQLSRSFPLVPTQPQTASALLPLPQTASAPSFPPLSQTIVSLPSQLQKAAPLPPLPQKTALHIKWQGQGIPGAKGNENAQASSDLVGPSLKRSVNEIPPAAIQVQRRKTKTPRPFIPPSMATLAQIAPLSLQTKSAPFPSQVSRSFPLVPTQPQTASALLPLPQTASASLPLPQTASAPSFPPLSQTIVSLPSQLQKAAPLPPLPQKTALHIKWQGFSQTPQAIGEKCLLCKRDLSFTPNGPVFQPTVSPNVAVLPCGHTFHDHCLQLITPPEQANNPPCIPCAIGES